MAAVVNNLVSETPVADQSWPRLTVEYSIEPQYPYEVTERISISRDGGSGIVPLGGVSSPSYPAPFAADPADIPQTPEVPPASHRAVGESLQDATSSLAAHPAVTPPVMPPMAPPPPALPPTSPFADQPAVTLAAIQVPEVSWRDEPSVPQRPESATGRGVGTREEVSALTIGRKKKLQRGRARRERILAYLPGRFEFEDDAPANPYPFPWYSNPDAELVTPYEHLYEEAAARYGVDPDLLKAIAWIESTHGWWDELVTDAPKTIRPMNVYAGIWADLGVSREDLEDPRVNIEAAAYICASIASRVDNPSVETIATLYNDLGAIQISDYGVTVAYYYRTKPWVDRRK